MNKLFCLVAAISLLLASCNKNVANTTVTIKENSPAPEVTITGINGAAVKLSELKGKVVLLNFWATWCPPCRDEIPSMVKLNNIIGGKSFQMLAVSIDEGGRAAVESFLKSSGMNLPAYIDSDNRAARTYGIKGVPETFIIDKQGILVKKIIGPIEWDNPEVVAFLDNLMK